MRNDTKRLGRPPAYDRDQAVKAATEMFWQKGFAATSLDDIARATGMNRPSLYAAFGDKRAMYRLALKSFGVQAIHSMTEALSKSSFRDALSAFYDEAIALYTSGPRARGCFIASSGAHEAAEDDEVQFLVMSIFGEIDGKLKARFQTAHASHQLLDHLTAPDGALFASAILHSLAVQARAGSSDVDLRKLASVAVRTMSA